MKTWKLVFCAAQIFSSAWAAPFAYVPNERSGTVSVIDTASDQVVATIKAGGKPRGIAASPDGRRLYVSDQPSGALLILDLAKSPGRSPSENPPKAWVFPGTEAGSPSPWKRTTAWP